MKITYKNYTIEPEARAYNLWKTVVGFKKETKEKYNREDSLGYGMQFETCIEAIIKDSLADRKESISLRQYIDEYKSLKSEILNAI